MVKVQQPKPKSLIKLDKAETNGIKKKSIEKSKKSANSLNTAKAHKKLLIEKEIKVAEIVEPVKKPIKGGKEKADKKPLILAPPESPVPVTKSLKGGKEKKADKKSLILAPPESPVPVIKSLKGGKEKKADKKSLILAPPESPSPVPVEKVTKINKKRKVGKAPSILAPPESPSPAPVEKVTKINKEKKVVKAPLILAPPQSPSPAPVKKVVKINKEKKDVKAPLILAPPESPVQASAPKATKPATVLKTGKENNVKTTVPPQTASATLAAKPTKPRQSKAAIKKAKKAAAEATNEGVVLPAKKSVKTSDETAKPFTKKQKTNKIKAAYMKARKHTEQSTDENKSKKKRTVTYEPAEFDESKFQQIVNLENVKKIAAALKAQVADEVKKQKTSIFGDFRYFLNVASFKIANVPRRMVKLNLKHSLLGEDDDVAIIVADLKRGAKVDYDPTIQHYEDLFREAGVERLKIVPFNKLRNEMISFEAKRKFCNTYDYFLCDGRLSGRAHSLLGSYTQKPRAVLHAVTLVNGNLKSKIECALRRTAYRQLEKGDLISIPIGIYHFTEEQIAENILCVVEQLKALHAGGYANVRSMHLKIDIKGTSSLPLYISISVPPADTPYVIGPREQRMRKLKSDANKVLAQFTLTKDATLIKLDPTQVENKRKLREAHAALTQGGVIIAEEQDAGENVAVPAKKARVEENDKNKEEKLQSDEDKENLGKVKEQEDEDESVVDDDDDDKEEEEDEDDEDEDEEDDEE